MEPLNVTAILANGYVATDPWSPSLDAILAWAVLRELYGEDLLNREPSRDGIIEPALPLLRVGDGEDWHYACSSPIAGGAEWIGRTHKRFDDQHAPAYLDYPKAKRVNTASGRYKNYRMPHSRVLASSVLWCCIGVQDRVAELLATIDAIGKLRGAGHGRVLRWEVLPGSGYTERLAREHRPVPATDGELLLDWGVRPPGWLVENRRLCRMPVSRLCAITGEE